MRKQNYPLHIFLFLVTVLTTTIAGAELVTGKSFFPGANGLGGLSLWDDLYKGLGYSFAFLLFLTVHEFGHYFTAVYHGVRCSLPYYIPILIPYMPLNIGSFGAVIRIREVPRSRRIYFDIGVAGPLAGFVVALGMLIYGLLVLPPLEQTVFGIHPEYQKLFGGMPTVGDFEGKGIAIALGESLMSRFLMALLPIDQANLPPSFEMMHYPFIFVGHLTLFFTALNLLPIGQLDGGHVVYGLFGRRVASVVSRIAVVCLMVLGGTGVMRVAEYHAEYGEYIYFLLQELVLILLYVGMLFVVFSRIFGGRPRWQVLLLTLGFAGMQAAFNQWVMPMESNPIWIVYGWLATRVLGLDHPEAADDGALSWRQKALGVLAILIFVLCFTPAPIVLL